MLTTSSNLIRTQSCLVSTPKYKSWQIPLKYRSLIKEKWPRKAYKPYKWRVASCQLILRFSVIRSPHGWFSKNCMVCDDQGCCSPILVPNNVVHHWISCSLYKHKRGRKFNHLPGLSIHCRLLLNMYNTEESASTRFVLVLHLICFLKETKASKWNTTF